MSHDLFCQKYGTDFNTLWDTPIEWVEAPNTCRGGISGVGRLEVACNGSKQVYYVKKQRDHMCQKHKTLWQRESTFAREHRNLRLCQKLHVSVPDVVCFAEDVPTRRAILVTPELTDYQSCDVFLAQVSHAEQLAIMEQIGVLLQRLYQVKYRHGALYGKHVFIHRATHRIVLIDLEKMRKCLRRSRLYCDLMQLFRSTPLLTYQHLQCLLKGAGIENKKGMLAL